MYIKKITLHNFRVYYDTCSILFEKDKKKNIHVISGYNGFGKTTFLTSLVWCLYGKHMKDVEEDFRKQIDEIGGYPKYVASCLNKVAKSEDEKDFFVEVILGDVNIPSVACDEVKLKRIGYSKSGLDKFIIEIDGYENELTKEVGNDLFVQDFILPKEIAKFFFFDAEKIVQLAENKSIQEKRQLSKAYSEVLGIKKYEDLKKNLSELRIRFKKSSAQKTDKSKFDKLAKEIDKISDDLLKLKIKIEKREEEKIELRKLSDDLQESLIRKGSSLSVDDINNLKIDKYSIQKDIEILKDSFKEILEFAPFALSYNLLIELDAQVNDEAKNKSIQENAKDLSSRSKKILRDFKKLDLTKITKKTEQLESLLKNVLDKHLLTAKLPKSKSSDTKIIHDFSVEDKQLLKVILNQLKTSYAERVKILSKDLRDKRIQYGKVSKKLSNAESKESDGVIEKYRTDKGIIDQKIIKLDNELLEINQIYGGLTNEKNSKEKVISELAKKIKIKKQLVEKDKISERLIKRLSKFLLDIKTEKKKSLEEKILSSLQKLMHKKGLVENVEVEIYDELIDIVLRDKSGEILEKSVLSKGEQQLYATSILKALVDESNIEFPVFIDSPLQKFDQKHAKNIIKQFYPTVSKQVILFPLLEKEMTEKEFMLLSKNVKSCYLIKNRNGLQSYFEQSSVDKLFNIEANLVS